MAMNLIPLCLLAVVLSHGVIAYRPFIQPRRLFMPQESDPSVAEGIQSISRRELYSGKRSDYGELAKFLDSYRHRKRRSSEDSASKIELTKFELINNHDTLYVHWSGTKASNSDTVVALTKDQNPKNDSTTDVFVTHDYGQNWDNVISRLNCRGKTAVIDQFYTSKADFKFYIFTDIVRNCLLVSVDDCRTFKAGLPLTWQPSYMTLHPTDKNLVFGYDKSDKHTLYLSKDGASTWKKVQSIVRSFYWGVPTYTKIGGDVVTLDQDKTFYVEYIPDGKNLSTVLLYSNYDLQKSSTILTDVEDFEVVDNFLLASKPIKGLNDADLLVNHNRAKKNNKLDFTVAEFTNKLTAREYFVADATEDQLFVTVNHLKNLSNLYTSDVLGWKFSMSLPRILYHNPDTDISTKWLREAVKHRFVDMHKVQSMRGVYIATQLTPGAVGSRHLKSLITYDKGGKWQYVRAPTVDRRGKPLLCRYPYCSLHINLKFGSVYRYSPTEEIVSKPSSPGFILASAVANTNLKINPDSYMSTDGGVTWKQILQGKYHFAICNYGGLIVAATFNRATRFVMYSWNHGDTWEQYTFSNKSVSINELLTEPGEHTAIVSLYGTYINSDDKNWVGVHLNFTKFLKPACTEKQYVWWTPSDGRAISLCFLGRVERFQRRNSTEKCFSDIVVTPKQLGVCNCTRQDFMCDIGYEPSTYDSGCVRSKEWDFKLGHVPESCSAGNFYYKSRGYRKIPGDPCVNGLEAQFMPYKVPCPTEGLEGVKLTVVSNNPKQGSFYPVESGSAVQFSVSFTNKPNMTGVSFSWDYGDGHKDIGDGTNYKDVHHTYNQAGHYTVMMVVTNQMSYFVKSAEIIVQDSLNTHDLTIVTSPSTITADEDSFLVAHLKDHTNSLGSITYVWNIEGKNISTWQSVLKYVFKNVNSYTVKLAAKNYVSQVTATQNVIVSNGFMPRSLQVTAKSPFSLDVDWQPPVEPTVSIKGYQVMFKENGTSSYKAVSLDGIETSYHILGLKAYTFYNVRVATVTSVTVGTPTKPKSVRTMESVPGSPPVNVTAKNTGISSQVVLSWKKPTGPLNGKHIGYEIQYWKAEYSDTINKMQINDPNKLTAVFGSLDEYTRYVFQIAAKTQKGNGPLSERAFITTLIGAPKLPPQNVKTVSLNGSCQFFSWEAPAISSTNQRKYPVKDYRLTLNSNPQRQFNTQGKTQYQICGLKPFTSYKLTVAATSAQNKVGQAAEITFMTSPTEPGVPQQLHVAGKTSTTVTLTWKSPKVTNGKLVSYEIKQISPALMDSGSYFIGKQSGDPKYTITKLNPYVQYTFSVAAKNEGENVGKSVTIKVTTSEDKPGSSVVVSVSLQDPKSSTAEVSWTSPEKPNGKITKYRVAWVADSPNAIHYEVNVPGDSQSYVVKYLKAQTQYSFSVIAVNMIGAGPSSKRKTIYYTATAPTGTKRYTVGPFTGSPTSDIQGTMEQWKFVEDFAKEIANTLKERIAGIIVNKDHTVQFDILGSKTGTSVDKIAKIIKSIPTIVVQDLNAQGSSLKEVEIKNQTPVANAQHGNQVATAQSSTAIILGIIFAIVILVLLFVSAFYYRKFKALDNNYSKFSGQYHRDTEDVHIDSNGFGDDDSAGDLRVIEPPQVLQPYKKRRKEKSKDDDMKPLSENIMLDEDHILA